MIFLISIDVNRNYVICLKYDDDSLDGVMLELDGY